MTTRKDRHVSVDLLPEQKEQLRALAEKSGMSVSDYMRACIINALKRKARFAVEFTEHEASNTELSGGNPSAPTPVQP